MVKVTPKLRTEIRASAKCPTHARSHVKIGKHEVIIDEPTARGGTDKGPSPTEMVVASLAGCTNVVTHRIAEQMGVEMKNFSVDVVGHFDRRGVTGQKEIAVPFPKMELTVSFTTDASKAKVREMKKELAKRCPVSKVLREGGTKIKETWNVTHA